MGYVPSAFSILAAAGFGSAAGSLVMAGLYAVAGQGSLAWISLLVILPAMVVGGVGVVGVQWGIRRDRRLFLDRWSSVSVDAAKVVEEIRR